MARLLSAAALVVAVLAVAFATTDAAPVTVAAFAQCGGKGGECAKAGRGCVDGPWPSVACADKSSKCVKQNSFYWQCSPGAVNAYEQCGGLSCPSGVCQDSVWAQCAQGSVCLRESAYFRQCIPNTPAAIKAATDKWAAKAAAKATTANKPASP